MRAGNSSVGCQCQSLCMVLLNSASLQASVELMSFLPRNCYPEVGYKLVEFLL